jgi:hypothetical protein
MNTLPIQTSKPPNAPPSVDDLTRRSAQLRASLDSTLEEIAQRASPAHIKTVVGESVKRGGAKVVNATKRKSGLLTSVGAAGLAIVGAFWRRRRK